MTRTGPSPAAGRTMAVRQFVVGLIALPLSVLPFLAYLGLTPEGRLVKDKIQATFFAPDLPALSPEEQAQAAAAVPAYEGRVMALVYHGVGSSSDGDGGFVVSPGRFAEHLATLKAGGMNAVTAGDVAAAFTGGPPLPPKAVMITFDDGRADAMLFADRLLERAGMKATMFVITGAADDPGIYYASWKRLEGAARSGRWDLQAHTHGSHHDQEVADGTSLPALTSLARGESLDEYRLRVREDLARCSDAIEEHVGRRPAAFAYPFGAYGAERTNDPAIQAILREEVSRQYAVAFHQDGQDTVPLAAPAQDGLGLRRLEVQNWSGRELLGRIAKAAADSGVPLTPAAPPAAPAPAAPAPAASVPVPPPTAPATVVAPALLVPAPPSTSPSPPGPTTGATPPAPPTTTAPSTTTTVPRTTTTVAPTTSSTVPRTTTTAPPPATTVPPNCGSQARGNSCPK